MTDPDPGALTDHKAVVAGVVGAVVATATDIAVHSTPLARGAGVIAAVAGGGVAYVLEHGGVIEAVERALAPSRERPDEGGALMPGPSAIGDLVAVDAGRSSFVDDYTASAGQGSILHDLDNRIEQVADILGWKTGHGTIVDPVEAGTPVVEGKDFIE